MHIDTFDRIILAISLVHLLEPKRQIKIDTECHQNEDVRIG